ncbi:MAG TPA: 4Fe-4S dicluster domain-containing protein [Bryobacteraceae bacterium]|nr:4Fe-4S dicluster domain-containing protein [Bryobacteraceae bacterium]
MKRPREGVASQIVILRDDLDELVQALRAKGFTVAGPVARDGAVTIDTIETAAELPAGWVDEQEPGRYRLSPNGNGAVFAHTVGANSWKRLLNPPDAQLYQIQSDGKSFAVPDRSAPGVKYALFGVRPCDLAGIAMLDRVFAQGAFPDPDYVERRSRAFIVAVQCGRAAASCFCTSMNTGPRATTGFDLALTEISSDRHRFYVEAASAAGRSILSEVKHRAVEPADEEAARHVWESTIAAISRTLETAGLRDTLGRDTENQAWQTAASTCLACGNCTMVCPTCFCSTFEDSSDLAGKTAERRRKWDSCFSLTFSYIHGGSVRSSLAARYRQRILHKLVWWHDQFGSSGCVGCGRCTTWCPAGIDFTREVNKLRARLH